MVKSSYSPDHVVATRGFVHFLVVSLFIVFFVTLGYPLGNEKLPETVFGSYDSTGAAIIFVGMPIVLLMINHHYLK